VTTTVSIADLTLDLFRQRGFELPKRFEGDAELPPDITVVSSSDLMRWMAAFTSLVAFAASEEAMASGKAKTMAARYKQGRAQKYISNKELYENSGVKVTEKYLEYDLDADDDLNDLRKEELLADNYARLVKSVLSGFEAKYQLLSRELTRRGLAAERHFD
jgi:hypothetical protein